MSHNTWLNLDLFFEKSKDIDNLIIGFGCAHNSLSLPYFKDFLVYLNDKINKYEYDKTILFYRNVNKIFLHSAESR